MRVLFAIHDFLPRHVAGSELYALHLAHSLTELGVKVDIVCAEFDARAKHGAIRTRMFEGFSVHEVVNNWRYGRFEELYASPVIDAALERVLHEVKPDVLHVHNLLNLSFSLVSRAKRSGMPVAATLHDYTYTCVSGGQRFHAAAEHVCDIVDVERCVGCFRQSPFYAQTLVGGARGPGALRSALVTLGKKSVERVPQAGPFVTRALGTLRRGFVREEDVLARLAAARLTLRAMDLVVAPVDFIAREYEAFGLDPGKLVVSRLGFPPLALTRVRKQTEMLELGFVGTLTHHKGVHVLIEAMKEVSQLRPGKCRLTLFGDPKTFPHYSAALRSTAKGLPIVFAGGFEPGEKGSVYSAIDVVVVPSIWMENSPMVIHEAFQAGLPVVAASIGGIPNLVTDEVSGLLYAPPNSPAALAKQLLRLIDAPELAERLRTGLPQVKSMSDDAREWLCRYETLLRAN